MTTEFSKNLVLIFIFLIFGGASAGSAEAPSVLRWQDVQAFGRAQKNEGVKAAKSEVRAQMEAMGIPRAEWLPSVSVATSRAQRTADDTQNLTVNRDESYLVVTQNLFHGFSTNARQNSAEAKLEKAKWNLALQEISVRQKARLSFFQAWHQQKRVQYFSDLSSRLNKNLQLVRLKYNSGLEGKWAVTLLEVQKGAADLEKNNAQKLFDEALSSLKTLLGASFSAQEVQMVPEDFLETSSYFSNRGSVKAIENHPHVKLYASEIKQSEALKKEARSGFLPKVDLDYKKSVSDDRTGELPKVHNDAEAVQVSLTWNLFAGGATKSSVDSADQTLVAAAQHRQNALLQLKEDIEKQGQSFQLMKERYLNKAEERKVLKVRSDTVTSQYQQGTRKYADWEVAQTKLAEVEKEFLDIEEALLQQRASLEGVLGIRWEE